jgi:type I restriction enzyme S subunit
MKEQWQTKQLGDVITFKRGYDLPHGNRSEGSVPIVSSSGVTGFHSESKVKGPGVVTGRYGTLGEVFYIDEDFWPLNTTLYVQDFKGNDPRFISYFLRTLDLKSQNAAGAVPGLNRNHLHLLPVSVPDFPTQRRIADTLSAYDDLIENNTRRIAILEEMAQRLYREWFVHFRYPGHESVPLVESELGPIPEGWTIKPMSETLHILSGGTPKTSKPEYWNGQIPFFTPRDAPNGYFVSETEKHVTEEGLAKCNSSLFDPFTIFITARGTVGKLALPSTPMAMNQSCYALKPKTPDTIWFSFLNVLSLRDQLRQGAHGAVFDTIIVDSFDRVRSTHPTEEIIHQFESQVSPLFEMMRVLGDVVRTTKRARDLLLPALLSPRLSQLPSIEVFSQAT